MCDTVPVPYRSIQFNKNTVIVQLHWIQFEASTVRIPYRSIPFFKNTVVYRAVQSIPFLNSICRSTAGKVRVRTGLPYLFQTLCRSTGRKITKLYEHHPETGSTNPLYQLFSSRERTVCTMEFLLDDDVPLEVLDAVLMSSDEDDDITEPAVKRPRRVYQRPDYWASEWGRLLRSGKCNDRQWSQLASWGMMFHRV